MYTNKRRVWGIWSAIRLNSNAKWCDWRGPSGVYGVDLGVSPQIKDCLGGRPLFFRTRRQARECAKRLDTQSNITWTWVKHQVRPVTLYWEDE